MIEPTNVRTFFGERRSSWGDRDDSGVRDFIERYGRALAGSDSRALGEMWSVPSLVMSDAGVRAVGSRAEVESFFSGAGGQRAARPDIQSIEWQTERIALVTVRWPHDHGTTHAGDLDEALYTVRRDDDGAWRICCAIMRGARDHH